MSLDILMDPVTGDLPSFTRHARGVEVTRQRILARLQTLVGDWPLDRSAGVDWIGILQQKPVDLPALAATLAVEVRATPGVVSVSGLTWSQEGREITVGMTAVDETGETLEVVAAPAGLDGNPSISVLVAGHAGAIAPR